MKYCDTAQIVFVLYFALLKANSNKHRYITTVVLNGERTARLTIQLRVGTLLGAYDIDRYFCFAKHPHSMKVHSMNLVFIIHEITQKKT